VTNEDVVQRLDTVIAVLKLAHREELQSARAAIRADEVNAAILDRATDWTPAGKLMTVVRQKTKQSRPTVSRRIAALIADGLLQKSGGGTSLKYRATGVV
jgi:hypothetical protein